MIEFDSENPSLNNNGSRNERRDHSDILGQKPCGAKAMTAFEFSGFENESSWI
jgi:hypothetical protein